MHIITDLMQSNNFLLILFCINIALIIGFIVNTIRFSKIKKENSELNKKLGRGVDIREELKSYIKRVEQVEDKTDSIINYCKNIENNMSFCIQKIGIVRYSAFLDAGSDLSFALALLDNHNNGVVLNRNLFKRNVKHIC